MKKLLISILLVGFIYSCGENSKEDKIVALLKNKIGSHLPFKIVKTAEIEGGTAVIVDVSWCYWIGENNKIYCVNGTAKSIYNIDNPDCEDAPIKAMFSDIEKLAE